MKNRDAHGNAWEKLGETGTSGGRVCFVTLGCRVNSAETEGMKALFTSAGYEIVDVEAPADVCVINTCTVTQMGDRKSRQMIRRMRARNPEAIVAAVGCYVQVAAAEVAAVAGIDLVMGNNRKHRIVEQVEALRREGHRNRETWIDMLPRVGMTDFEPLPVSEWRGQTRAFLKIQDGCDRFCSYCIIPHARGPVRSRDIGDAAAEAERLVAAGFSEFVLTGIHLTSFRDETGADGLLHLLHILHEMEGVKRIRFGSLEPGALTPAFLDRLRMYPKFCPHFHISLQSGSAAVLQRMNRKYAPLAYLDMLADIRERFADVSITTDIMVGFPGETEEEFEESLHFCRTASFSWMHVFPYSPRRGTPAAGYPHQIPAAMRASRAGIMGALAVSMRDAFQKTLSGRRMEVLFEHEDPQCPGNLLGLTSNYVQVSIPAGIELAGQYAEVLLMEPEGDRMRGRRVVS